MQIAVDTRFLESDEMPEASDFTKEVFGRITEQQPEHHFVFFVDRELKEAFNFLSNVTISKVGQKPTNVFLYKWWYDVKLYLALKKHKADIFIASYGLASLTTSVPQVLVIRDLAFLKKRSYFPFNSYTFYRKFTAAFIKKAGAIATLSNFVSNEIGVKYGTNKFSAPETGSGVGDYYRPVDGEEREAIKAKFSEGCEYFVFVGGFHLRGNFLNALKAFSIFKKWQKTNMKFLIAGSFDIAFEKELEKLASYKYRKDVIIKRHLTNIQTGSVIAASYAIIFPSFYEGFATPVLAAMYCEVPVITSANSSMSEIAGDAALYANPAKPEEIAEQMKLIFKDEQLRNKLINASKYRSEEFSWDKTAAVLWKVIEETLSR